MFYYFYCQYNCPKTCLVHLFTYLLVHITPTNFTISWEQASLYPLYGLMILPSCVLCLHKKGGGGCFQLRGWATGRVLSLSVISSKEMFTFSHKAFRRSPNSLPFTFYRKWCQASVADLFHPWQAREGGQKSWSCTVLFLIYFISSEWLFRCCRTLIDF